MSFILDALKKSESERRDRTGPALAYAPGGAEREPLPRWVVVLAILLMVNLLVVGSLFLMNKQKPEVSRQDAPAGTAVARVVEPPAGATLPGRPQGAIADGGNAAEDKAAAGSITDKAAIPPAAGGPARSLQQEAAASRLEPTTPGPGDSAVDADTSAPSSAPAESGADALAEPDATDTGPAPPTLSELQGQGMLMNLPTLGVDLHVYAAQPQARFVFINLSRYREGERLREGPLVERITPDGVILQHEGLRFLLPRS